MKLGRELLYLSNADIEACNVSLAEVDAAVEASFAAKAAGTAIMKPKLGLHRPGSAGFFGTAAMLENPSYAGVKWVGAADNEARGLPHIAGMILLNDADNAMPVAVMDARWITGTRTAAISAVAARRLAKSDSGSIGFIACGLQARSHLLALLPYFSLKHVRAYSRRLTSAEAFAEFARVQGLQAEAVADPRAAIEGMDIVISTTPAVPRTEPFLDAGWLSAGSFTDMVDLGLPWITETMTSFDCVVTDDIAQAGSESLNYPKPYEGEVSDLVAGTLPGRRSPDERTGLVFAGVGVADVAVAAVVFARAREMGLGQVLPL